MCFFSVWGGGGGGGGGDKFRGQQGMRHQKRYYKSLKYPMENKIMSYKL